MSLGCSKNTVDSERIAGILSGAGYEMTRDAAGADVCVLNTCGFIRSAVEENIDAILDAVRLKSEGSTGRIIVAGCLVNRYGAEELGKNIPEVDYWVKSEDHESILRAAGCEEPALAACGRRSLLPGATAHVRYLKLSEGCNNRCSYCAIPGIRGGLRSVPLAALVSEAEDLAEEGAAEICLVAQDLSAYGRDFGEDGALVKLLDALEASLPPDVWLRLLYLQPNGVDRRLMGRVAGGRQTLPYLDMPIQHASPRILSMMNRRADYDSLLNVFKTAREILPDFALRTTCMVGFPGEKKEDFELLLRFLDEAALDRVGVFAFSPEEGTAAADMPDRVSKKTKMSRMSRLMALQEEISLGRQRLFLGKELEVLIDTAPAAGIAEGRSFREAPEVDGVIEIHGARAGLRAGEKITARIEDAFEHDMAAVEARV
jgi:ribosomal protein S12 methylthiotransferase